MPSLNATFTNFAGFEQIANLLPNVGVIGFDDGSGGSSSAPQAFSSRIQLPPGSANDAAARNIFAATQGAGDTAFNSHPAIRMLVDYMKKTVKDKDYGWRGSSLQQTVFPGFSMSSAPDAFSVGGLDDGRIRQGGCALLVKAFYNACRGWDDRINIDKVNQNVADVNNHIRDQKTATFVQYYRWAFAIRPSDVLVNKYKTLLLSSAYRNLKVGQANSPQGWNNSNLEMFCHFVKLSACGASDTTLTQIYDALVHPSDGAQAVDGGYFSQITPTTWRLYAGWISSGLLDFSDLGASNLTSSYNPPAMVGPGGMFVMPAAVELVDVYTSRNDYRKSRSSSSSSCFTASTLVLMASGEFKPISHIKIGEAVATRIGSTSTLNDAARVVFVSKPPRHGRKVYAFKDIPTIGFTDTHPLVTDVPDSKSPAVRFVDPLRASSMNPIWRLLTGSTIDPDLLAEEVADENATDELLYDLVFEQNFRALDGGPTSTLVPKYIVGDGKSNFLRTMSEAPIAAWLPLESVFVRHVMEEIQRYGGKLEDVYSLLESDGSFACQLIDEAASKIQPLDDPASAAVSPTHGSTLEDYLTDDDQGQVAAAFIETLLARVGRAPTNIVSIGWIEQYRSALGTVQPGHDVRQVLVLRRLQVMNTDVPDLDITLPIHWRVRLWRDEKLVVDHKTVADVEGPTTIVFQEAFAIRIPDDNSDNSSKQKQNPGDDPARIRFELSGSRKDKAIVLIGRGDMIRRCDTWINLVDIHTNSLEVEPLHAVIQVEIQDAAVDAFNARHDWKDAQMSNMAAQLGRCFGAALLERATQLSTADAATLGPSSE